MTQVKKVKFCFYKSQKVYPKPVFNGIYINPVVVCGILLHWELNLFSCMSVDWVSEKLKKILLHTIISMGTWLFHGIFINK